MSLRVLMQPHRLLRPLLLLVLLLEEPVDGEWEHSPRAQSISAQIVSHGSGACIQPLTAMRFGWVLRELTRRAEWISKI